MNKKEEFKEFVQTKPELINNIKNGTMTWQKYYELYDLYGSDSKVWDEYTRSINPSSIPSNIKEISKLIKNINAESIQKHINTAQKALGLVQDLTTKNPTGTIPKGPTSPRPLNKFFED